MRTTLKRRTLLLAGAAALAAGPAAVFARRGSSGGDGRRAYQALVDALVDHGSLPGPRGRVAAQLDTLYADALPARRREIDAVLDALTHADVAKRPAADRLRLLREWAASGGERRALAAQALALASASHGPDDDRALPVVI